MTFQEFVERLDSNPDFWRDKQADFQKTAHILCHPDRWVTKSDAEKKFAAEVLSRVFKFIEDWKAPAVVLTSDSKKKYEIKDTIASGDVADIYNAVWDGNSYIVKASRVPEGIGALKREEEVLKALVTAAGDKKVKYDLYLPAFCESFSIRDRIAKRVNVYRRQDGFYTLDAVHRRHPQLDERHLVWIYKRLLSILGFVHQNGWVHGAICPSHLMVNAENHGIHLIGWGQSVKIKEKITKGSSEFISWYPKEVRDKKPVGAATDLYMASLLMIWLSGGDVATWKPGSQVTPRIASFWKSNLLDSPNMRAGDAWELSDEFNKVVESIYGKPRFTHLVMS